MSAKEKPPVAAVGSKKSASERDGSSITRDQIACHARSMWSDLAFFVHGDPACLRAISRDAAWGLVTRESRAKYNDLAVAIAYHVTVASRDRGYELPTRAEVEKAIQVAVEEVMR